MFASDKASHRTFSSCSSTPTTILPALLFSLFFILPAWWLWQRDRRAWAAIPLGICLLLLILTISIKIQDVNHLQASHDVDVLLHELRQPDLWLGSDLADSEEQLFLASTASQALYRAISYAPERKEAIDSTLYVLAEWATRKGNLSQWGRGIDWDREIFFLAHAGAIAGHYQLATDDETSFGEAFRAIGNHLGKRMQRGRYKHLFSRRGEDFFRPADNAAALYTLSLYDQLYGTQFLEPTFDDWSSYIQDELYYAEARIPCSAFNATNRCHLEPSASATGLYIAYRASAAPERIEDDIPWREWLHYFKRSSFSPFSMSVRSNMRKGQPTRFCNLGAAPIDCNKHESAIGLWAAAEYKADFTYFRLFSTVVFRRWFYSTPDYASQRPAQRISRLTTVALRAIGEGK